MQTEIVFVFPHLNEITGTHIDSFRESLGTGYIRAYLAEKGIRSVQYVQYDSRSIPQIVDEILSFGSSIVGFSCYDCTFYFCVLITRAIKLKKPEMKIIFGGPSITLAADWVVNHYDCIDICCRGDGEEVCYDILQCMREGRRWDNVAGISFRSRNEVMHTAERLIKYNNDLDQALDVFPSPYLTGMMPSNPYSQENQSEFAVISSRGCPFHCTYCTNTALRKHQVHFHSIDRVIDEIRWIGDIIRPEQRIVFYDDAFTLHLSRAKKICARIIQEKLNTIHFDCVTRVDRFDEELLNLMAQAGFKSVYLGLESASPEILYHIKKVRSTPEVNQNYTPELNFLEVMKKNVKSMKEKGLNPVISIILGLPAETERDALGTLAFIEKLGINMYMHNLFKVIHGTESFESCSSYGIMKKPHQFPMLYLTDYAYNVYSILPLKNSIVHRLLDRQNNIYILRLLSLFGVKGKIHVDKYDYDTIHIFLDETNNLDEVLSWLAPIIQLSSDLYIVEPDWRFSSLEEILHAFVENSVPLFSYRRLQKKNSSSSSSVTYQIRNLRIAGVDDEKYSNPGILNYRSHIIPFHAEWKLPLDLKNEAVLRTINSIDDLQELLRLVEGNGIRFRREDLIANNYEIVDKCRWSAKQCDICYLRKLLIFKDREVFACYSGQPVGRVGEDYSVFSERIQKKKAAALESRGCHVCPVFEVCPQCIFLPSFLNECDYCRYMKQFPRIRIAAVLPSLVHELFLQQPLLMEQAPFVNISWLDERILGGDKYENSSFKIYPWHLLKVEFLEKCYLFYPEKSMFIALKHHWAEIWDLLNDGAGDRKRTRSFSVRQPIHYNNEFEEEKVRLLEYLRGVIGPARHTRLDSLLME